MADIGDRRRHDRDHENDIVASAFASYRAEAPEHFAPRLSAAALLTRASATGGTGRPRRRSLAISMTALACTALMAAGVAVAQSVVSDVDDTFGAKDTGEDYSTFDDDHTDDGVTGNDSSPDTDPTAEEVEQELQSLTISLPDWPGDASDDCPAGDYRFAPNAEHPGAPDSDPPDEDEDSPSSGSWQLLPDGAQARSTRLVGDDDPSAVIVPVACGDIPGVVALTKADEGFDTLGFVYAAEKPTGPVTIAAVDGPIVTLAFGEQRDAATVVTRQFSYDDGEFVEVQPDDDPSSPETTRPGSGGSSSPADDDDDDDDAGENSPSSPEPEENNTELPVPHDDSTSPDPL